VIWKVYHAQQRSGLERIPCSDGRRLRAAVLKPDRIRVQLGPRGTPLLFDSAISGDQHRIMVTANICMCGSDGSFDSMGEGMIVNFDGSIIAHGTHGAP
jgi:hypothetical protein